MSYQMQERRDILAKTEGKGRTGLKEKKDLATPTWKAFLTYPDPARNFG